MSHLSDMEMKPFKVEIRSIQIFESRISIGGLLTEDIKSKIGVSKVTLKT